MDKDAEGTGVKFPFNFLWAMTDEELESMNDYLEKSKQVDAGD